MVDTSYGSGNSDPARVAEEIGAALGVAFEERDSSYWGGGYYLCRDALPLCQSFRVFPNLDLVDRVPIYKEHEESPVVILCEQVRDQSALNAAMAGLNFTSAGDKA